MKVTPAITTAILALLVLSSITFQASAQRTPAKPTVETVNPLLQRVVDRTIEEEPAMEQSSNEKEPARSMPSFVRTVDFYLKDGQLIFGKVIADDRNKIIVEKLDGSTIVAVTYSRKQIEPRSISLKNVPASKFYLDQAEYFAGQTWDFKDDPDDFILAVRCYERAKLTVNDSSERGVERLREIDEKIKSLQEDRKVWAREIEGRAKLKELEFQAEYQNRFKELQDQLAAAGQKIDDSMKKLEDALTQSDTNQQKFTQDLAAMDQEVRRQLSIMAEQIQVTRRMVDPFYRPPVYRYRQY